jgi:3-dehydroquinate synthase
MVALSEPERVPGLGAPTPTAPPSGRALVLIGFMGAGKTTVARAVAQARGGRALDSDALLEERLGVSVADAFERDGEASFREIEEQLVLKLLSAAGRDTVLALGGGSVLSESVQAALAQHVTVLLEVGADEAWRRVAEHGIARPLARSREQFIALHAGRQALYASLADAILPALPAGRLLGAVGALEQLANAPRGPRLLWATAASGDYPVYVGRGLLDGGLWPLDRRRSRAFCVTDETVASLYGPRLAYAHAAATIPPGERHKTLASAERVWQSLVGAGMTRADHVAAVGGGVVGDLAGFCASTYQRGVDVVHVPTTLVSQVDSAYGGKTGVDLPGAKNYVGAYHQPAGVVVDPTALDTLPAAELAAGYAEVLKTALIAGGELWRRVSAGEIPDERMILSCARAKLAVVAEDERDYGRRQVLNLGHTVAHAIEAATGYERFRHGEAVGLGLLAALRLSGQDALRAETAALLHARGLPTRLEPPLAVDALLEAIGRDKKRTTGPVPYVLVHAPGDVREGGAAAETDVRGALLELGAR